MSWRREGDRITIDMDVDTWDILLLAMGMAAGTALRNSPELARNLLALANKVNEGNPDFAPYAVEDYEPLRRMDPKVAN